MKKTLALALAAGATIGGLRAGELPRPDWAYAVPQPGDAEPPRHDDGRLWRLPGAKGQFTYAKIQGRGDGGSRGRVAPADWYPALTGRAWPGEAREGDAQGMPFPAWEAAE